MGNVDLSWLWGSLIGVGGTLLGTLFGWLLARKSHKKLDVRVLKIRNQEFIYKQEHYSDETEKLDCLEIKLDLLFYNPSDVTKMIDDITFETFDKKNKPLFSVHLNDIENRQVIVGSIAFPQNIDLENIPPHFGVKYFVEFFIGFEELKKKDLIKKAYIAYMDEKGKRIKVRYSFESFSILKDPIDFEKKHQIPQTILKPEDDE